MINIVSQNNSDEDEPGPKPDFSSGTFLDKREPIKELINTFSDLYIDSEEEVEGIEAEIVPDFTDILPPPPEPVEEQVQEPNASLTALIGQLTARVDTMESRFEECVRKMNDCVTFSEMQEGYRAIEERMSYRIERECERVQNKVNLEIQDLGKSMVDCLKRRDVQIDHKLKDLVPLVSTPIQSNQKSPIPVLGSTGTNQTYHVPRSQLPGLESMSMMSLHPPVKLDFPNFSNNEEEDPVTFIERCEEYFAI